MFYLLYLLYLFVDEIYIEFHTTYMRDKKVDGEIFAKGQQFI